MVIMVLADLVFSIVIVSIFDALSLINANLRSDALSLQNFK